MTQSPTQESAGTPAPMRPARPNLFAAADEAVPAGSQRISVLASLDTRPPAPPARSRKSAWIALGCLLGISVAGAGTWFALNSPEAVPSDAAAMNPAPAAAPHPASSTAESAQKPESAAAPASIERLPPDTQPQTLPSSQPEVLASESAPAGEDLVVPAVASSAPSPVSRPGTEIASARQEEHKSLLHTLAAPQKPAPKPAGKSKLRTKEPVDTDVILLEALVTHSKKARPASEAEVEATP